MRIYTHMRCPTYLDNLAAKSDFPGPPHQDRTRQLQLETDIPHLAFLPRAGLGHQEEVAAQFRSVGIIGRITSWLELSELTVSG